MLYTPPPIDPKAPPVRINLLSDTQTKPTAAMREAMARAEVGDEQVGDDPTVNALCERVAELLGKEAAVYMPSGTMCNVTATLVHCRPGDEILAHESAHIIAREGGAHAAIGGFQVTQLKGPDGQFTPETFRKALHPRTRYQPPQTVVSVEQTANIGGGTIWKKAALDEIVAIAKQHGLVTHMDGARLLNATVASGISPRDMTAGWDSAWIDFSKGLGAPIGGVLAGSRAFIDAVWQWKQRLGGSMRQAGICAGRVHLRTRPSRRSSRRRPRQRARTRPRTVADLWRRRAGARDQSRVLQARWRRHCRRQDGCGAPPARRDACDDGRPHPCLHPSRRQCDPDRGDDRLRARDRARGLSPANRRDHRPIA
ncbi:threonine aldolase [Bradyrhizobium sp. LM3.2]